MKALISTTFLSTCLLAVVAATPAQANSITLSAADVSRTVITTERHVITTKTKKTTVKPVVRHLTKFQVHSRQINKKQRALAHKLAQAERSHLITAGQLKRMQDFMQRIEERERLAKKDRVLTANERKKLHGMLDNADKRLNGLMANAAKRR